MAVAAALTLLSLAPKQSTPRAGMVVTRSIRFAPGTYALASADPAHPAIVIRGSNITVDFSGVTLRGSTADAEPDRATGVAILVDGGDHVTIRNARAHGYKIGIVARNTTGLHITGGNLSYNWKPRLYSLVEHESLVDWLSYHHNESDEWLEKGAGIYLADSKDAEVDNTTITQGENGLMLARSNGAKIWNNNFSYLSGVGLGLYRSSNNNIQHNRIDFCVRGYSHGFYNRGQDSAGILVYEQSSRNFVGRNSVTHDGDGLFLWAGQTTMDTGDGGANSNVFYDNDFSFAATNGIEATFSQNAFLNNRVEGNWHGVWGGYSFRSDIAGNRFSGNVEAIAIEHGQDNYIAENSFDGDETAIHLWQNASQDPEWGYPKHRDTRSRDYTIIRNKFIGNKVALKFGGVTNVLATRNTFSGVATPLETSGQNANLAIGEGVTLTNHNDAYHDYVVSPPIPAGTSDKIPDSDRRGREAIIVDEWGPYDWQSPKLWPDARADASPLKLRVLGPTGQWSLAWVRGATVEPRDGSVPGDIVVTPVAGNLVDWNVQLTYIGERVVSPRGAVTPAGQPYAFGYSRFLAPIAWDVRYYAWTDQQRIFADEPIKTEHRDRLDYMSGRSIAEGIPADRVAIRAEGIVTLPAGQYEIRTISDDGVRVWVDDERVIDDWTPHESAVDNAPLAAGKHTVRVEYYEVEGFAELRFDILRR